jgi:hypothetical protein
VSRERDVARLHAQQFIRAIKHQVTSSWFFLLHIYRRCTEKRISNWRRSVEEATGVAIAQYLGHGRTAVGYLLVKYALGTCLIPGEHLSLPPARQLAPQQTCSTQHTAHSTQHTSTPAHSTPAHQHTSTQHTVHKPRDTATQLQLTCIWFHVQKFISPFKTLCSVHKGKFIHDFAISNTALTINKLFWGKTRLKQTKKQD